AVALAVVSILGSWAIIGFDGFRQYLDLLHALDRVYAPRSASIVSLGMRLGLGEGSAHLAALLVGFAVLGLGVALVTRTDGDRRMFAAAVLAAIATTPIIWMYYFVFLFAPLALYRRTLGR